MAMTILGLGLATPSASIAQPAAAAMARDRCCRTPQEARLLQTIYRQSMVRSRGSVLLHANGNGNGHAQRDASAPEPLDRFYSDADDAGPAVSARMRAYAQQAPALALEAARGALVEAAVAPESVDQVVVVSCTGFVSPGLDFALIRGLGLKPTVGRTLIGFMGCHGAINGLRVADALAASQPGAIVLLVCVELCSLHFQYGWDPQQVVANALFADGAAAVVGQSPAAGIPSPKSARGSGLWTLDATGSCVLPDSSGDMTWTIGDHGFRMSLSARVPRLIGEHLRPWVEGWLASRGLTIGEVGSWAIHPGGPRIVDAAAAALGLDEGAAEASRAVLAEHGNMSSPTVLFIADRLRRTGAQRPTALLAFGPGLVVEAALLG